MTIKRPNYVLYDEFGNLKELFCKVCGSAIAGTRDRTVGKRFERRSNSWVEERVSRFTRFSNYAELKMVFSDGSAHVTNGCNQCLHEGLSIEQLKELHDADMDVEIGQGNKGAEAMKQRIPVQIVAIRTDGGGIP